MRNLSFLFLSLMLIVFVSCEKRLSQQTECIGDELELSSQEIIRIGELHNEYLLQAFDLFDYSVPYNKYGNELRDVFNNISPDSSIVLSLDVIEDDLEFKLQNYQSSFCEFEKTQEYYFQLMALIENAEEDDLNKFHADLLLIEQDVSKNLMPFDESFMRVVISVTRNSAILWFKGEGMNYLAVIHDKVNEYHPHLHPKKLSWREVLASDAIGASGYFLSIGFAFTPPVISVGALAFTAGFSSATAALFNGQP